MTNTRTTAPTTWIVFSTETGRTVYHCTDLADALALRDANPGLLVDQHVDGDDDGPAVMSIRDMTTNTCPQSGQLAPVFSRQDVPTITCPDCDQRFSVEGYESVKRFPVH